MILGLRRRRGERDDYMRAESSFTGEIRHATVPLTADRRPEAIVLVVQLIGTTGRGTVGHSLALTGKDVDDLLLLCRDTARRRRLPVEES